MARTKQTPRKPKGGGSVKAIPPKNKGKWGTAGQMIQHPIPNLPTHPTQNRSFYRGMYCRHCTIIMLYMLTQSIHLYCNTVLIYIGLVKPDKKPGRYWKPPVGARGGPQPAGQHRRPRWRPGTQALHEIRHYQRTTKLCIPKIRFIG